MRSISLRYLVWFSRRSLERLGLFGVVGLGILAFCGMYLFSTILPERNESRVLQREFDELKAFKGSNRKEQLPAYQLQSFYETFPSVNTAADVFARLHREAKADGVDLDQGDYRLVRNEGSRLVRYGVTLPIKGDYMRMRKFLSKALADIPNISLDSVEFQRQKISDTTLEAQVKMTLFLLDK
jgi:hypothetical protein